MSGYAADVLAWADHLRTGGTLPWADFRATGSVEGIAPLGPQPAVPGAAQLELVRRLAGKWQGPGFAAFADRVLAREGPGRGMAHSLPLVHPQAPDRMGAPPIDPAHVPVEELIRIGVGLLTDVAVAAPVPEPVRTRSKRSRRRPKKLEIVAPSLDELLTQVWARKTMAGAAMPWRRFVRNWAGRDEVPFLADPTQLAARAAGQVHVYVGSAARPLVSPGLPVESLDLLRRMNPVLGLRVPEGQLADARASAVRLLEGPVTGSLAVPAVHREWAQRHTERIVEALRSGGYSVHGDLAEFAAGVHAPQHPRARAVLDRLLDVLVRSGDEQREVRQ